MFRKLHADTIVLLPLFLQLFGLIIAVVSDPYIKIKYRRAMIVNIIITASLVCQNYIGYLLDVNGHMIYQRILVGIYGYIMRPVVIMIFIYIVDNSKKYKPLWILIVVNGLIYLTAIFSDISFTIDANNNFHRGPLGYSCHIVSAICLIYLLYIILKEYNDINNSEAIIPLFNGLIIVAGVAVDTFVDYRTYRVTYMMVAVVSACLFYYIWLHLQFAKTHEKAVLAEHRIQIMMTQIQPHFLYNTLSTIQALCRTDPEKAFFVTEKFGRYLRENLNSLNQPDLIPIEKEIEHTKTYAEIEMVRFPSVTVEYDIKASDFSVPALTIQPLVENAIKHGVRVRKQGLIKVTTLSEDNYHLIIIADNGKGFDSSSIDITDESLEASHIGIRNVKERIEKMCKGSFKVESIIGEGTTITIKIPK